MDKIICPVTLTGDHISPERIMCGYAGNYGIYRLQLSPGEGWEGLDVRVTWETAGEPVVTWPDAEGFVDVPPEATADSTRGCRVATVVGLADGVKRISASLLYSVRRGGAVDGKDPAVPTPDVAEMLLKEMDAKLDVPTGEGQTGDVPVMQADGSTKWGKTGLDVSGAKVGQTVEITAVDAEGKPTAWKAVEYMAKASPTGTGAFSMGRKAGSTVGTNSHAEGSSTEASGEASHAEGRGTTASGTYSHAEGRGTIAIGKYSHAEGTYTFANGDYSHTEGTYTSADGEGSHAEGIYACASGSASHAEGYHTVASGNYSHTEGSYYKSDSTPLKQRTVVAQYYPVIGNSNLYVSHTTAKGVNAHAEGAQTLAFGDNSHSEGIQTNALGANSHAEGNFSFAVGETSHAEGNSTLASSDSQHVQGKYNIKDADGKYAHIVGNGSSSSARSNAHTLDWSGNAWYAGTVEGTAMIVKSSTEGSTKRFKITVDDSGTISATEV